MRLAWCTGMVLASAGAAAAQSNISTIQKRSWLENAGWLNWRDANNGAQGVRVGSTFLSGFIWGENIGWINTGDGTPTNGTTYANVNGTDFGVNIAPNGDLFGKAWSENCGWINFDTRATLTPFGQQARLDRGAGRFRGYAWGENLGWMNMSTTQHYVALTCYADCDTSTGVGVLDIFDFLCFQNEFAAAAPYACDCDQSTGPGVCDIFDFLCFQNAFANGCP